MMTSQSTRAKFSEVDLRARRLLGRPVSHLTPRYCLDRLRLWHYQRRSPDAPWLTADAITLLEDLLHEADRGLEFGSGRSTSWLAQRTQHVTTVESSPFWYRRLCDAIESRGLGNVAARYVPADEGLPSDPYREAYVETGPEIGPESLGYVLIDGLYRAECAQRAIGLLKPGGLLVLDNANWFVPHPTQSPFSTQAPRSPLWSDVLCRVADWRLAWTSNGVWDTAIWIRP